jgi:DNA-binding CsgD family transcriptional regulator
MRFGIFYEMQLPKPWGPDDERRLFHEALEQVALADGLGYDYAWEVEHHFLEEYSHSSAPEVFLAAAASDFVTGAAITVDGGYTTQTSAAVDTRDGPRTNAPGLEFGVPHQFWQLKDRSASGCRLRARCPSLTRREISVCESLLRGRSAPEVAAVLGIRVCSVQTYRKRAYTKLGVSSLPELFNQLL